ncbi:MAG: hypothetical protein AUJ98_01795 [Bacteroidetes bacterium CG2_30_33_31]|nr:MAG: hypothetical protein AUJ98_01795 [Bacteroidetes bacterium CG2_30_33_31]
MKSRISNIFKDYIFTWKGTLILYVFFTLAISFQSMYLGKKVIEDYKFTLTHQNNYQIFKYSFHHLAANTNLYKAYSNEYWDLYKYSPSFAVFFAPMAVLPDWLGLSLWNLINSLTLLFAIYFLPNIEFRKKLFILLAILIETLTSLQSQQSNALIAGLIILSYGFIERKNLFIATALLTFSVYIKLFGIVGFAFFLFYPQKWKAALYGVFWFIIIFALPLLIIDFHSLINQYNNWGNMLALDHDTSLGLSVMSWLSTWFKVNISKNIVLFAGAIIYLMPFVRIKQWQYQKFRLMILASTLIWVVIFNHKAESPTFVIAMVGAAIWFFNSCKSKLNNVIFIIALLFTSLSPTDIFPVYIRTEIFVPYVVKSFPMILIYGILIFELLKMDFANAKDD